MTSQFTQGNSIQSIDGDSTHSDQKLYRVNGTKFLVDKKYQIIKSIGYGAYGFVW